MAILTSKGARAPHQLKGRRNVRISRDRRGSGTDDIEALRNELLQVIENSGTPIGTIISYAGANAPQGYLLCQGQAISKSEYAELYLAIGDLYSNDETAEGFFNVPDLRECVPVGIGTNSTNSIASHDVYELGQFKDDQMQGHSHNFEWNNEDPNNSYGGLMSGGGSYNSVTAGKTVLTIKGVATDGENGTPRVWTTTHGKQIGLNYIIKY